MDKEFWRAAGMIFAFLVGAPIMLASIRAVFFFGQASQSIKNMEARFNEHVAKIDKFIDEMHDFCEITNKRLNDIEVERRMEEKFGRRAGDKDVTKREDRVT